MGVGASISVQSRFNGRRRWPLHVRCRRKKFTFAISSSDEFLVCLDQDIEAHFSIDLS